MWRVEADVLVPGKGEPIPSGCVIVDGSTITYAGASASAPASPGATVLRAPAVMPGLWDCHTHFLGLMAANVEAVATTPVALSAMRAVSDAGKAIDAGVTSVRETGGYGVWLARAIDEGSVVGPSVYGAGAILSPTGGHADLHMFPHEWVCELADRSGVLRQCDGVAECLRAVRLQLRSGARLIKICASGGVMSEIDHPVHQQFSADELRAIVEEAGRAERVVAAHCHGKPGIMAALEAGVRTIEHGTYLDEEAADAMVDTGAILVPTRLIVEEFLEHGQAHGMPDYAYRKLVALAETHRASLALARERGVTIAAGTDICSSRVGSPASWGRHGRELGLMVKAGLTSLEAIEAATATAPSTLGPQAPKSGRLEAGYDADVIALTMDPSADVGVLGDPANVTHVIKAGQLLKGPR